LVIDPPSPSIVYKKYLQIEEMSEHIFNGKSSTIIAIYIGCSGKYRTEDKLKVTENLQIEGYTNMIF